MNIYKKVEIRCERADRQAAEYMALYADMMSDRGREGILAALMLLCLHISIISDVFSPEMQRYAANICQNWGMSRPHPKRM